MKGHGTPHLEDLGFVMLSCVEFWVVEFWVVEF